MVPVRRRPFLCQLLFSRLLQYCIDQKTNLGVADKTVIAINEGNMYRFI